MKYTKELTLKACAEFVPTLVEHSKAAHTNIPELLRHAAIEAFKQINIAQGAVTLGIDKSYACLIIQVGLREIADKGMIEFGSINQYWG
jgi:hypothetical protein